MNKLFNMIAQLLEIVSQSGSAGYFSPFIDWITLGYAIYHVTRQIVSFNQLRWLGIALLASTFCFSIATLTIKEPASSLGVEKALHVIPRGQEYLHGKYSVDIF
ncbi:MAG: hypothetical protein AAGI14_05770 [Pseudomonadota bacterium]